MQLDTHGRNIHLTTKASLTWLNIYKKASIVQLSEYDPLEDVCS